MSPLIFKEYGSGQEEEEGYRDSLQNINLKEGNPDFAVGYAEQAKQGEVGKVKTVTNDEDK